MSQTNAGTEEIAQSGRAAKSLRRFRLGGPQTYASCSILIWSMCILCSCSGSDVQLASGPLSIGPQAITLRHGRMLPSRGPVTELCIQTDASWMDLDIHHGAIPQRDGSKVAIHATALDGFGMRRALSFSEAKGSGTICGHVDQSPDTVYHWSAVELSADRPITVGEVRWSSYARIALP